MFLLNYPDLPPDVLVRVTHRDLASGQVLYRRGDPATAVFAVQRGRLKLLAYTSEGQRVPLYVVRPGEWVSEAALFAGEYCSDVVAEIPSRVAVVPKEAMVLALQHNSELATEFMRMMARRWNLLRMRLELRALHSARERIMQYFLAMAPPGQKTVRLDRPLKSIAEDLGLTHESFYRSLAQLIKDGVIHRNKTEITVNYDPDHRDV
ncbi:MAG: Crp/Fnr family transcriptional regulator [Bryobacteraceae bacterium]|nr:Crp/Fnr family transcriptional regulator [Bryobacteraceae bacterium]